MFDRAARKTIDPPLRAAGRILASAGVTANQITVTGFLFGMAAAAAIALQFYWIGFAGVLLNRLCDGLDGATARMTAATDVGGYLDIVLDVVFYGAIVFAFALAQPEKAVHAAFLLASFYGSTGSFLAYAIIAEKRKLVTDAHGAKSFYYMAGLAEGGETVVAFLLMTALPSWFGSIAIGFGILCLLTLAGRLLMGWQNFSSGSAD